MAQQIPSRFELNKGDERHKQDFGWNCPLCIRTDVVGLQLGKVAEGWQRREHFAGDEVKWQGRHGGNIGYPDVQGGMGKNLMMTTLWMNQWLGRQLKNSKFAPHNPFINHFIVCISLELFGHVGGSFQAPRCFPWRSILSRTLDMIIS